MRQVPTWELVSVTVLQSMLCIFNVFVTWRSFAGWSRNCKAARSKSAPGTAPSEPAAQVQAVAVRTAAPRQHDAGMAPPTAHIAVTSSGRAWGAVSDDVGAVKRSAQNAYGQHVKNAARQRKALERAQEEQETSAFPRVTAGSNAVRVC